MRKRNKTTIQNARCILITILLVCIFDIRAQSKTETALVRVKRDTLQIAPSFDVAAFRINSTFSDSVYRANFKIVPSKINIYDLPYSSKDNYPNYKRLAINTGALYAAGFLTLGVLYALPEDATAWNKTETIHTPPLKRWWRNVRKGPVVDKDNFVFNYVLHPYGGAAYYMGARSLGFNVFYSGLYATAISTFFWEYGIEAFMEIPSIQDLIITPVVGTIIGEGFYRIKRNIVSNDYRIWGSSLLGNIVAYLIDPVNEVVGLFAGNPNRGKNRSNRVQAAYMPWINRTEGNKSFGFTLSVNF